MGWLHAKIREFVPIHECWSWYWLIKRGWEDPWLLRWFLWGAFISLILFISCRNTLSWTESSVLAICSLPILTKFANPIKPTQAQNILGKSSIWMSKIGFFYPRNFMRFSQIWSRKKFTALLLRIYYCFWETYTCW